MFLNNKFINLYFFLLLFSLIIGAAAFNFASIIFILRICFELIRNKDFKYFKQKWFLSLLLLYIVFLISSVSSEYTEKIILKNLSLIRYPILILSIQYFIKIYKKNNLFLFLIFFITLFVAFDSLVQYYFGFNLLGNTIDLTDINRKRLTGVFGDEQIVGSFIVKLLCPAILGSFLVFKKNYLTSFVFFIFMIFIILVSQERMPFITSLLIFFIIGLVVLYQRKFRLFITYSALTLIILTTTLIGDTSLKKRYLSLFSTGSGIVKPTFDDSGNKKIITKISDLLNVEISFKDSMWGAHFLTTIEILKNNPIIGSGTRSFRYECQKKEYEKIDSYASKYRCSTHPHNIYLEIFSENGFIGGFYFVIILLFFYYNQIKICIRTKNINHTFAVLGLFANLWPIASMGSVYASMNIIIYSILFGYVFSISEEI